MSATKTYALIGKPLAHSFSKAFYTNYFTKNNIDAIYKNLEINDLKNLRKLIEKHNLSGINITKPFKEEALNILDDIDPIAQKIGAVNLIKVDRINGQIKLMGYNTDHLGFSKSIDLKKYDSAFIFGWGGAAKAVSHALTNADINTTIVSRNPRGKQIGYYDLKTLKIPTKTLLINCTPLGMNSFKNRCIDLDFSQLNQQHLCYDLIYNPSKTVFLNRSEQNGAKIQNGKKMLELQALEALKILGVFVP